MAELTEREKRIVHMMNVMLNPMLNNVPSDLKTNALKATLIAYGYQWNETEMADLMGAISSTTKEGMQHALKILGKYGDAFKGLDKL